MKFTVTLALSLLFLSLLPSLVFGQGGFTDAVYPNDEFVIVYDGTTTDLDRQELRALYGITQFQSLFGGEIEVWESLAFPMVINHIDGPVTIIDVDGLELDINTSSLGDSDPRARVSDGDFNYDIDLDDDPNAFSTIDVQASPLPDCGSSNFRVFGSNLRNFDHEVNFIIFDQVLDHPNLNGAIRDVIQVTDNPGGTHANRVTWVIDDILNQQGINEVTYTSIGAFGADGSASYADILVGFSELQSLGTTGAILNFSANLTFADRDIVGGNALSRKVSDILVNQNILMVSSAGNDANTGGNVFPGCFELPNEITVVGTDRCFSTIWEQSNTNPLHYEIAAEAKNILVNDGSGYQLSTGTSFAAPLVSAAFGQLKAGAPGFSAETLRGLLLNNADIDPGFLGKVAGGKVLNTNAAITNSTQLLQQSNERSYEEQGMEKQRNNEAGATIYPNPFSNTVSVQLPAAAADEPVEVTIINTAGQVLFQAIISEGEELLLNELPTGMYLLKMRQHQEYWVQKVIKR